MLFTSESVTEGHPDKLCDQISDAVLDACLRQDPLSRVACNAYVTMGLIVVGGEVTTKALFDVAQVVRDVGNAIGYSSPRFGLDVNTAAIAVLLHGQSADIDAGVSRAGAGDQGAMFGYACNQTKELMPLPIVLAHRLAARLAHVRKTGELAFLGPDGKTQVTVEYAGGKPIRVDHVVLGASHGPEVVARDGETTSDEAKRALVERVVLPVVGELVDDRTAITINGAGKFVTSGPHADTGMTGRKNVVDTYGGWVPHGGGAFSGKDPTKVDRSAGYMARYVAKNVVAAGLADECLVQLAYCIGVAEPVSLFVDTRGTGKIPDDSLTTLVRDVFPLTPKGIIEHLDLRKPIYLPTAAYGHFGRPELAWERTDATGELLSRQRDLR